MCILRCYTFSLLAVSFLARFTRPALSAAQPALDLLSFRSSVPCPYILLFHSLLPVYQQHHRQGKIVTVNRYFSQLFGVSAFEASGRNFQFLCGALTNEDTMHNFPSSSTPHIVSKKDKRAFELGKRLSTEFSAVLSERHTGKAITCHVVSLPVTVSPTLHGEECLEIGTGVYFVVCFQQLFVEDVPLIPLDAVLRTETSFQPFGSFTPTATARAANVADRRCQSQSRPATPDELAFFQFEA